MRTRLVVLALLFPLMLCRAERPANYDALVAASKKRAVALYPDAGIENTRLWKEISAAMDKADESAFDDPNYPATFAARAAAALNIQPVPPPQLQNPAVAESMRLAALEFPALIEPGSEFNRRFIKAFKETSVDYLAEHPDYPMTLARAIDCDITYRRSPAPAPAPAVSAPAERTAQQIVADPASFDEYRNAKMALREVRAFGPEQGDTREEFWRRREQGAALDILSTGSTPYDGPRQRNGRPLPRNWIDPDEADAKFAQQELERKLNSMKSKMEQLQQRVDSGW